MKRSVVIGLVVGVIVVAAGGVGYAAYKVNLQGNEQDRKAEVIAAANVVDDQIDTVFSELEAADKRWDLGVEEGDTADMIDVFNATRDKLNRLKGEVEETRELIKDIPSESVQASYLEVCDKLDESLDESLGRAEEAGPYLDAWSILVSAEESGDAGWEALNESILACNRDDWTAGKDLAKSAETNFQTMRDGYGQAAALVPDCTEVTAACPYADGYIELARQQHELAVLGSKGSINSYNKQIEKLNDLKKQVQELGDLAATAHVALWDETDSVYGRFELGASPARNAWSAVKKDVAAGKV